jgi:hypothetical protein
MRQRLTPEAKQSPVTLPPPFQLDTTRQVLPARQAYSDDQPFCWFDEFEQIDSSTRTLNLFRGLAKAQRTSDTTIAPQAENSSYRRSDLLYSGMVSQEWTPMCFASCAFNLGRFVDGPTHHQPRHLLQDADFIPICTKLFSVVGLNAPC